MKDARVVKPVHLSCKRFSEVGTLMIAYLNDVIDIVLVAFVFYQLIKLIRGTRAVQLLKGFMVIVAAWLVSIYLELKTMQWLMSQAFTYGVLAILIIFQPELRRALEQLGRGSMFSRAIANDDNVATKVIGELVKALQ